MTQIQGNMVFVCFQMVGGLSKVRSFRGGSDYPAPFGALVGFGEIFALDFFEVCQRIIQG